MNSPDEAPLAYPTIRQSLLIAGIVILLNIACAPIIMLYKSIGDELSFFVYYLLSFGLSLYIVNTIRKRKQGTSPYDFRIGSWRFVPLIVLGTAGLLMGAVSPIAELIPMPESVKQAMERMIGSTGMPTFLCLVLAAPILEEVLFRGIMLDGLLRRCRPITAILLSSFLFGFIHLNPWQFVAGFVLGCFFGWIYYRTGSVGCCILGHMSANGCGYVQRLILQAMGIDVLDSSGVLSQGILFNAAFSTISLTLSALSIYLLGREFNKLENIGVEPATSLDLSATQTS